MEKSEILKRYNEVEKLLAQQKPHKALNVINSIRKHIPENEEWLLAKSYFWEAICYKNLLDEKKALKASNKGILLFRSIGDFVEASKMIRDQGLIYEYSEKYDKSLEKLFLSIDFLRERDIIDALGITYSRIGQVLIKKGDYYKALYYCELGFYICNEGKNLFFLLTSLLPLTMVYYKLEMYLEGLEKIRNAEDLLKDLNKRQKYRNKRREGEIYLRKALLQKGLNTPKDSFNSFKKFALICLSVKDERNFFLKDSELKELIYYFKSNSLGVKLSKLFNEINLSI